MQYLPLADKQTTIKQSKIYNHNMSAVVRRDGLEL